METSDDEARNLRNHYIKMIMKMDEINFVSVPKEKKKVSTKNSKANFDGMKKATSVKFSSCSSIGNRLRAKNFRNLFRWKQFPIQITWHAAKRNIIGECCDVCNVVAINSPLIMLIWFDINHYHNFGAVPCDVSSRFTLSIDKLDRFGNLIRLERIIFNMMIVYVVASLVSRNCFSEY